MEQILENMKAGIAAGIKNANRNKELVKEGTLNLRWGGSVTLDCGLWAASAGIQDEIEKSFPGTTEFTVTITVVPNVEHNRRPQGVRVDGPVGPHSQEE